MNKMRKSGTIQDARLEHGGHRRHHVLGQQLYQTYQTRRAPRGRGDQMSWG